MLWLSLSLPDAVGPADSWSFFSKFPGKVSVYAFFVVSRCRHVVFVAFKLHVLLVCGGLLTKCVIFGIVALFHSLGHAEAHAILHFPSW